MANTKYDWLNISKEFIQGVKIRNSETNVITIRFPTLVEIAEKYNIPPETVSIRSAKEKWGLQRQQYQRKLKIKNTEVSTGDLLGISSKFDALLLKNLENLASLTEEYIKPYMFILENEENVVDNPIYEDLKPLTPKDIKELIQSQEIIHKTVRSILGESPTESLLDDVRNSVFDAQQRKGKKMNKAFVEAELKRIQEIKKHEQELEARREELKAQLKALKSAKEVD